MILFSVCKINLGLRITERRNDGFHNLETIFYPVSSLCDIVEILHGEASQCTPVKFSHSGISIDCTDDNNLCVKAYRLMHERYSIGPVRIHLCKRIPFGAGLGGGSANAAAVLRGLSELFTLNLTDATLAAHAAELGSDTPFFIHNTPMLGTGRGEILTPCAVDLQGYYLLLVKPDIGVSTARAYSLIHPAPNPRPLNEIIALPVSEWKDKLINDFETPIFEHLPSLKLIRDRLYSMGCTYAAMSGSGSTVYGLFPDKPEIDPSFNGHFVHLSEQL